MISAPVAPYETCDENVRPSLQARADTGISFTFCPVLQKDEETEQQLCSISERCVPCFRKKDDAQFVGGECV